MPDEPILRPWRTSDAPALLRHRRTAADVARELPELADVGAARHLIERWNDEDARAAGWHMAIVVNGVAIGSMTVGHVHREFSFGWLGYWMSPTGRGHGWSQRAAATLADWALCGASRPVFRLESGCRVDNHASAKVLAFAGFRSEGLERQKLQYNGQRFDAERYSRLATDPRPAYEPLHLEA